MNKFNAKNYFETVIKNKEKFKNDIIRDYPNIPLFLCTKNNDKISEFNHFFSNTNFYFLGFNHLQDEVYKEAMNNMPCESGSTLLENSIIKSRYGAKVSGIASVADDTGFFIDILNGEPGIYAGRYAGEEGNYEANRKLVLTKLRDFPFEQRTATFKCVITLKFLDIENPFDFLGEVSGYVLNEKRPGNQFGYDPIFMPKGYDKAFSEMPIELKNKISHRGLALQKLYDFLTNNFKFE